MPPGRSARTAEGGGKTVRVHSTDADPLAALTVQGVDVDLAGRWCHIPRRDAVAWLQHLLTEDLNPEAVFPGLCEPEEEIAVLEHVITAGVTPKQMEQAFFDTLEAVTGRRWWVALRLLRSVRDSWDRVGGVLALHGITGRDVSVAFWLDAAYAVILDALKEGDVANVGKFTSQLVSPPPGHAKAAFNEKKARQAFKAAMAQAQGSG